MNAIVRFCDLQIFDLKAPLPGLQPTLPTACLLVMDTLSPTIDLNALVGSLIPTGCRYFMTWGRAAEELHDRLDDIIGERGWGYIGVLTAVHKDERSEDVAWFLVNAALPGEARIRCFVGYQNEDDVVSELLAEVHAAVSEFR
jgi:hypothetical protein